MKDMTGKLVDDWDVAEKSLCPVCKSSNTDYVSVDFGTTTVYEQRTCAACGTEYTIHYTFSTTYVFKDGRFNKEEQ